MMASNQGVTYEQHEDAPLLAPPSVSSDPAMYAEQVERAYKFLIHPKVASASMEKRIAFLESKDCSQDVIERALRRAELNRSWSPGNEGENDLENMEGDEVNVLRKGKKTSRRKKAGTPRFFTKRRQSGKKGSSGDSSYYVTLCCLIACLLLSGIVVGAYFLLFHFHLLPSITVLWNREFASGCCSSSSSSSNASNESYNASLRPHTFDLVLASYSFESSDHRANVSDLSFN